MSDNEIQVIGSDGSVADYIDEVDNTESEVPEETTAVEESGEDNEIEEVKESEDTETEKRKPWEAKKSETPVWAKKRFREYSSTVRELKDQNKQLMDQMKTYLGQQEPERELTHEDFENPDEYINYKTEQNVKAQMAAYRKEMDDKAANEASNFKHKQLETEVINNALQDLPDYQEQIQNGDPDITLPKTVLSHLATSPAGPYVKYLIATDDELSEELKYATTAEQKRQIIAVKHDEILDELIARGNKSQPTQEVQSGESANVPNPVVPTTKRKQIKKLPKAPPRVKGGGVRDISSLSGDEYARARNEQLNR